MDLLERLNSMVWGIPTLVLIIGVGLYLSVRTGFAQLRLLPASVKALFGREDKGTSFRALCTALAATVGTGNIAGVAGAIAIGGPGSIFWMWVCGILGMVTKFAEALLAVRYRIKDSNGAYAGGPMYIMERGLGRKWRPMAVLYSLFGVVAAFGVGNATQVNAVVGAMGEAASFLGGRITTAGDLLIGVILAVITVSVFLGGFRRVSGVAELLVPVASAMYLALCLGALAFHYPAIPKAMQSIFQGAFCPQAVTGGAVGSMAFVLRTGAARGVFTNEAGMGTAAIAHGTSNVAQPAQQGLMGILEVFIDTIVICTMTALVILTSGAAIPYGTDPGVILTARAFACTYGQWISIPMALFLAAFAFATILGWGYYGMECARYLWGGRSVKGFAVMQGITTVLSTVMGTEDVWRLAELFNGLMTIPNLLALAMLSDQIAVHTKAFIQAEHRISASGKSLPKGHRWRRLRCRGRGSPGSFHH